MDRASIEEHIAQAERHVTLGLRALARAEQGIAFLKHRGHIESADSASWFLHWLRENQVREAHRDRPLEDSRPINSGWSVRRPDDRNR